MEQFCSADNSFDVHSLVLSSQDTHLILTLLWPSTLPLFSAKSCNTCTSGCRQDTRFWDCICLMCSLQLPTHLITTSFDDQTTNEIFSIIIYISEAPKRFIEMPMRIIFQHCTSVLTRLSILCIKCELRLLIVKL